MKKIKHLRTLLVLFWVLIGSLTTYVWAWTAVYLNGNFTGNNWNNASYQINYELDGSNSGHYFYPFYSTSGDKYWRLYAQKDYKNYQLSPSTDNFNQNVGTSGYKVTNYESWGNKNFKTTNIKNGVTAVHINQSSGGDLTPYVWLERPTIYIWHNWNNNTSNWNNNGGSGQKAMTDNEDGTYTYDGLFAGTSSTQNKTNVGIEGSAAIKKYFSSTDATVVGSPTTGDKCRFTWNSSGYKGYGGETADRGSLTITKLCKVTYDGNSKTSGTVPSTQSDIMYNTSVTLASKGTLAKTNYVFTGWNTAADGTGDHYDAGETITATATTLALYAEWQYQYGLYGTGDIFDEDWDTWVGFPNTGTNTYGKSITLTNGETYVFKVVDRSGSGTWWGNQSGTNTNLVINRAASGVAKQLYSATSGDENITITPDVTGPYTFSYNSSSHTLTITYPTSYTITFGIGDLNGSNSAITASATPSFSSGDYVLRTTAVTFNKGTTKAGYQFDGWYPNSDGSGVAWSTTDANWTSNANTRSANIKVYACYSYQTYSITYKDEGNVDFSGTHGDGYPTTHTYNTGTDLVDPTKTGYDFDGWFTNSSCTGVAVTSLGATAYTDNITLYAKWSAQTFTVTLDAEGGSDGTDEVTATFDDDMPSATMPSRDHYNFDGYYASAGGSGTKYYNADGSSNHVWDVADEATLHANWIEKKHTVSVEYKYGATTIHAAGSVSNVGEVTSAEVTALDISGYTFTGWTLTSGVTSSDGLTSGTISIKAFAEDLTITANYELATYEADLLKVDGDNDGAYSVKVGDTELTIGETPTWDGYHVYGYYVGYNPLEELDKYSNRIADAEGALVASVGVYTDGSGKWKYEGAPDLYTRWLPNNYTIKLMRNDGTDDYTTSTVDMGKNNYTPTITVPERSGYSFDGYFTGSSSGTKVINADGSKASTSYIDGDGNWQHAGNVTLYAHWTANPYTITLNNQSATTAGSASISVTFDATTNLTGTPAITVPAKTGYTFGGYYTDVAGAGVQIIAANGNVYAQAGGDDTYTSSTKQWKYPNNTDLYAKWTQTISFDQNGATVDGSTNLAATFNGALSTSGITNPNKIGYAFAGWATAASDGTVVIAADGTVTASVSGWTDASSNWIHAGESELVATWTADVNNFKADAATTAWGTATNWSQNKVPTEYTEVHIKGNATVSSHVYVGKVVIEEGTLTIASTGALEVAGTITNTDEDKLVVNSRGALIFDNSAGSTYATVELSTTYASAGSHFQFIGLPVWGVSVSTAFAGKGVYTYAWKQGEGWERRGYYDDLMAFEAIALMGSSGYTFHGALVSTADKEYSLTYADRENGDVYMYGNSWTAPIKVSGMTIDSYDGAHIYDGSTGSWDGAVSGDVIPAMQAFAVLAKSGTGGSVSIPYNTAVRNATSPNAPLRAPQRNSSDILDHISIYVTGNDLRTRMRLFENEQFTNEIDNGYEAIHMEGEGRAGELYAQADDKMTVLATPNLEGTVVGFIPGEATNYTISFEGDGKGYYLNDVVTNQSTLIAEGNTYMFTPDENTNDTRFIISKTPIHNMPTGVDAINDGVKARKQLINGILYIIRDGRLYDTTGALVK